MPTPKPELEHEQTQLSASVTKVTAALTGLDAVQRDAVLRACLALNAIQLSQPKPF
jgi:hypothetical protein